MNWGVICTAIITSVLTTIVTTVVLGVLHRIWYKIKSWCFNERKRQRHKRFIHQLNALDTSKYDDEIAKMIKPFVQPQKQTSTKDKTNKQ